MGTILENKVVALVPVRAGSATEPEIGQDLTWKKKSYSKNSGTTILLTLLKSSYKYGGNCIPPSIIESV